MAAYMEMNMLWGKTMTCVTGNRLDPQDAGPGYRNVIGLPGGVDSPLFQVLKVCLLAQLLASSLPALP